MKKLSFLLAMLLVLSSMFAVPVFADTTYTYDGINNATNTFAKYGTATSGLTSEYNVAGPLKTSTDKVYHVSGTSTITDANWYKYCFNKALKDNTDFTDKTSYTFSMDVFFPSKDATTKNEITVQAGVSTKVLVFTFRTGSYQNGDAGVGKSSGKVFYGLEEDRWHNIVIDVSFADKKTEVFNVYKDGVKYTEHYSCNSSNAMTRVASGTVTPSAFTDEQSGYYFTGRPTLNLVTGDKFDFYFDNVIYKSGVTYSGDTKATISTAVDGVVTVDAGTTAAQVATLATGASAVEVYRADSSAFGFAQVTDAVAKDDIIKLVTANGSYSYYTLDVKEEVVVNPFVVGELTAPALNPAAGSTVSASLALSGDKADKNVTLILCVYKGITLIDIKTASITKDAEVTGNLTTDSITVPSGAGNYTAKAFVWDTLTGMQWVPTN